MADLIARDTTTFETSQLGETKADVRIGGSAPEKFVPNVNVSYRFESGQERYWYNVNAEAVVVADERVAVDAKEVCLVVGDVEERYSTTLDTDGRDLLKWIRVFRSHPGVASWTHRMSCASGVRFTKQPPLAQWEIDAGATRPDEVVGAYVVSCNRSGVEQDRDGRTVVAYRNGKMGTIYPPVFTDANGKTKRGELEIDAKTGLYRVSVDERWFSRARFPVRANDTFGYETNGASTVTINKLCASFFSAPADGTVTQLSAYLSNGTDSQNLGYYDGTSSDIQTHIAHGTSRQNATSGAWYDWAVSGSITSGVDYWLAVQAAYVSAAVKIAYDAEAGYDILLDLTLTYDTWANDPGGGSYNNGYRLSIYATYTAAGGANAPTGALMGPLWGPLAGPIN